MQKWSKYKIIFSDFDGTIIGSDYQPSNALKESVTRWQKSGRIFSIVTGKPYFGPVKDICQFLGIKAPVVVNGGALIIDSQTDKIIDGAYINRDEAEKVLSDLRSKKLLFEVRTDKKSYASHKRLRELKKHRQFDSIENLTVGNIVFFRIHTHAIGDSTNDYIRKEFEQKFPDLHIIQANAPYAKGIEITSKFTSKHTAVLKIIKMLNIDVSETIGVGDELNDYPLLTACNYKVVMQNGNEKLKEIADEIIPSYDKSGVAVFIDNILS